MAVAVVLAVCAGVRVAYLLSSKVAFNADEAVTGIMANRIQHGHEFAFYAGQHYGGPLEQYLQALTYAVIPLPHNAFTLRLPQVGLSMTTCGLVILVGRRLLGGQIAVLFAALLFAVSPWFNVVGTATSQGFYVVGQTLGTASWWVALRLTDSTRPGRWGAALGLMSGLALWSSVTTAYFLVPAAIWVAPVLIRQIRICVTYVVGLLVGATAIVWQLVGSGRLPIQSGVPVHTSPIRRLGNLFGPVLREFIGASYGHDAGGLPRPVQVMTTALVLTTYAVAVTRRRTGLADLLRARFRQRCPSGLVLLAVPVIVLAYAISPSAWYVGTPRYLLIAYPLLALGLAALLPTRPDIILAAGSAAVILAATVMTWRFFSTQGPSWQEQEPELRQIIAVLGARQEVAVLADYWTAMPLLYLARDRIAVGVTSGVVRFPDEQRAAQAADSWAYVATSSDGSAARQEARLRAAGQSFRTTAIGRYVIIDRLTSLAPRPLPRYAGCGTWSLTQRPTSPRKCARNISCSCGG